MNPSTPTFPTKSIRLKTYKSATTVSSGTILEAHLEGSTVHGTVWHKGQPLGFTTTLTMAQLVAGWPSINVNVKLDNGKYRSTYISSGSVAHVHAEGAGTTLDLTHGLDGILYSSIVVSDSISAVEAMLLAATSPSATMVREDLVASGVIQGGAPITSDTTLAVVSGIDSFSNDVAATLPTGVEGMEIDVEASRLNFVAGELQLFPALGENFLGLAANAAMLIAAGTIATLVFRDGEWKDRDSADTTISIAAIAAPSGAVSFQWPDGTEYMNFSNGLADLVDAGLKVAREDVELTASTFVGATPTTATNIRISICATDGFALKLAGTGNVRFIHNDTLNTADVYGNADTVQINGVAGTVSSAPIRAGALVVAIANAAGNWQMYEWKSGRPLELTAFAGGGQASATVIAAPAATVAVCATNGDSLKLTDDYQKVTLSTGGIATQVAVFPNSGASINGGAANASVILPGRCIVTFSYVALNTWTMVIELGPQSDVAKAGGGASFATPIIGGALVMGTVASANDSFILSSAGSRIVYVSNPTLTSARIFPPTSGTINGAASFDVATTLKYIFITNNGVTWFAELQ